jgi:hypothetical protein
LTLDGATSIAGTYALNLGAGTGNVGINSATPSAKLDVVGSLKATTVTTTGNVAAGGLTVGGTSGAGYVLMSTAGDGVASWQPVSAASASGDVDGPASATDNTMARFDGATGKIIQGSGITIDDSNNVSGIAALTASGVISGNGSGLTGIPNTSITGLGNMSVQNSTTVNIDGGSVDGVAIGASTASTGAFTTLASSGKTTVQSLQVTGGSGTANQVLFSDAGGNATWGTLASIGGGNVSGTGTTNYLPTWTSSSTLGNSNIAVSGANVSGIGTLGATGVTTLGSTLGVTGLATLTGGATSTTGSYATTSGGFTTTSGGYTTGTGNITITGATGNIGVGSAAPTAAIDVMRATGIKTTILTASGAATVGSLTVNTTGGASGTVLSWGAGNTATWTTIGSISGAGDVDGPASATQYTVPRYADTTGKLLTTSGVSIDASNNVTGAASVTASGAITSTAGNVSVATAQTVGFEGTAGDTYMKYDAGNNALVIYVNGNAVAQFES